MGIRDNLNLKRPRTMYRETYRPGALVLREETLPELKHISDNGERLRAVGCEILAAGLVRHEDGKEVEYHDLRVYFEVIPNEPR